MSAGSTRTPALAIVDSRNIFHQTEEATGFRRRPTVRGVVNALHDFGFETLEVHIGVALPRARDASKLSNAMAQNDAYKKQIESDERGEVLLGELHHREDRGGSRVEEKQVDVACAVDVCRHANLIARRESDFEAIVVLSQDTDLTPALSYATELGVPLVVAATRSIKYRGFPYIHLPERSFRQLAELSEPLAGHALRSAVAETAQADERWEHFKLLDWDATRERYLVQSASGLVGVTKEEHLDSTTADSETRLRVTGVDFGRRRSGFPLLNLTSRGRHPDHDHRELYVRRTVRRRKSPERIELDSPVNGKRVLDYPAGGLTSGMEVLIDCSEATRPLVVGPTTRHDSRDLEQASPLCVRPVRQLSATTTIGVTEKAGRVMIAHSSREAPTVGMRYAAVLVESGGKGAIVQLISSALP